MSIRNYTTLAVGDLIRFQYNSATYEIAILSVSPDDGRGVIGVVETDLQVDFAPPVGYEEPAYTPQSKSIASSLDTQPSNSISAFAPFSGPSNKLAPSLKRTPSAPQSPSRAEPVKELQLPKSTIVFPQKLKKPADAGDAPKSFAPFSGKPNKLQ